MNLLPLKIFGVLWIESAWAPIPSDLRRRWLALLAILSATCPRGRLRRGGCPRCRFEVVRRDG